MVCLAFASLVLRTSFRLGRETTTTTTTPWIHILQVGAFVAPTEYNSAVVPSRKKGIAPSTKTTRLSALPVVELATTVSSAYGAVLHRHPLATKSLTAGVLCGVGDVLAQSRDNNESNTNSNNYNLQRTLRFASKGCLGGILWTFWYDQIDAFLRFQDIELLDDAVQQSQSQSVSLYALTGALLPASANASILAFAKTHLAAVTTTISILMEQFLWCPLVYGTFEIPVSTLMNGGEPSGIKGEVESKLNGLLVSNAKVWTLANLVIYNAPLEWRLFIGNVIDIFWQSIVSDVSADCGGPGQEECKVDGDGDAVAGENSKTPAALADPNYDEQQRQQGAELMVLASTGDEKERQRNSNDLVGAAAGPSLVAEKSRI